jgi:hypothetical protein
MIFNYSSIDNKITSLKCLHYPNLLPTTLHVTKTLCNRSGCDFKGFEYAHETTIESLWKICVSFLFIA